MKIYTRRGDAGETGLYGGDRVGKDHLRVATYGDIDEGNAALGLALAQGLPAELEADLRQIQSDLFELGAELAAAANRREVARIVEADVTRLEDTIDRYEAELAPLRTFVLPGGTAGAGALHLARTVVRRAERALVTLGRVEEVRPVLLMYVNRLSDLLFVMSRVANHRAGVADVPWQPRGTT